MNYLTNRVKRICVIAILLIILGVSFFYYYSIKNENNSEKKYPEYVNYVEVNLDYINSMENKDKIFFRIINSIDFFKTSKGNAIKTNKKLDIKEEIEFQINNNKGEAYVSIVDASFNKNIESISTKELRKNYDNINKTLKVYQIPTSNNEDIDIIKKLKPLDRFDSKKDNTFIYRNDGEYLSAISSIFFNQEVQSYLKNYDNWDIDGEETYLNRECTSIKGNLGFVGKNGEREFKLLVDNNTGIIIKNELSDLNGNIVISTIVSDISIDGNIDESIFNKDDKKYNLISN